MLPGLGVVAGRCVGVSPAGGVDGLGVGLLAPGSLVLGPEAGRAEPLPEEPGMYWRARWAFWYFATSLG